MKLSRLAQTYDRVSQAKGEPQRVKLLSGLFRELDRKSLAAAAHLTAGQVVDPQLADRLGIGPGAIRNALAQVSGHALEEIDERIRKSGDLSEVVAALVAGRDTLTVDDLWRRVNRAVKRDQDRLKLIEHVFGHTTPNGAKYFTRMVLNQMRIGAGIGALAKALAEAFGVEAAAVERLYAMTNDIGLAAARAGRGPAGLRRAGLAVFRPYQFMNAHKVDDPAAIFARLAGKRVIFEVKYDGARLQIHVKAGRPPEVRLYSRRLNDDTASMPDVVAALQKAWRGGDAIVEGEAVAYDPKLEVKQPFQAVLMRLGRKHEVEEKAREIPLVLYLFDALYDGGEDLMGLPQRERQRRLKKLFRPTSRVKLTHSVESDRPEDERRFFGEAIKAGHEGLVAKDPDAPYLPGKRIEHWMKLKPEFETLDVVVVGGIWGSGRRRGTLSSLVVAVRDKDAFKTVGKVGTGFSEETLRGLTAKLEPLVIATRGRDVEIEPQVVIEVDFQDIQRTSAYAAGYALRIPRFKRERADKSIHEADNVERLKRLYRQAHR